MTRIKVKVRMFSKFVDNTNKREARKILAKGNSKTLFSKCLSVSSINFFLCGILDKVNHGKLRFLLLSRNLKQMLMRNLIKNTTNQVQSSAFYLYTTTISRKKTLKIKVRPKIPKPFLRFVAQQ